MGLQTSDLVGAATVVGPLDGSRRARVSHGPARYSGYDVNTFLFTAAGVRHSRAALDLASGSLSAETRATFLYQAVSSVGMVRQAKSTALRIDLAGEHEIVVTLGEGIPELDDIMPDASGAAGALPVLESIAAEGTDWLLRSRLRLPAPEDRDMNMDIIGND